MRALLTPPAVSVHPPSPPSLTLASALPLPGSPADAYPDYQDLFEYTMEPTGVNLPGARLLTCNELTLDVTFLESGAWAPA